MRYQISHGSKSFSGQKLFEDVTLDVRDHQKIAIIGRNGSGKSTLLKIMANLEDLDDGMIHKDKDVRIGYLSQNSIPDEDMSVAEYFERSFAHLHALKKEVDELMVAMEHNHDEALINKYGKLQQQLEEAGGYTYQQEMQTLFTKFGFKMDELNKSLKEFSGGQKTRIALVKLLITKPDILLLDEPTNHLDLTTIKWLEGYLKNYPKAIVMVSHDRIFIDELVDTVYELELGKLTKYPGNYSDYKQIKKQQLATNEQAYYHQQKEIERLTKQIDKFKAKSSKAKFAKSKQKYLDKMEKVEKMDVDDTKFKISFKSKIKGGNQVLSINDLTVGYDKELFKPLNLEVIRKQRIAIVGHNGCGKSTLLKTLVGKLKPLKGNFLFGHQIEYSYFDQNLIAFQKEETVLDNLWSSYPELNRTEVRTILGTLLFSGDDVLKEVHLLSGGEKVRLAFAHMLLEQANCLILDEPTNHLDILGKEALEDSLNNYDGTMLFVSHDRYFIQKIATHILDLDQENPKLVPIEQYEVKKVVEDKKVRDKQEIKINANINYGKEVSKIEKQINKKETKIAELKPLIYDPEYYNNQAKMADLEKKIENLENELAELLEKWEELSELMELQKK